MVTLPSQTLIIMVRKLTTDEFIEKAKAKHGLLYDYSKVVYVKSSAKVVIVCKFHGEFLQRPNDHLTGKGCSECADNVPLTTKTFIEKSTAIHNGLYDYSLVDYIDRKQKVKIICKVHGTFLQRANDHLKDCGCPECGVDAKRSNTETFIKKAIAVHGNRFDYSQVDYSGSKSNVVIICKEHGAFLQSADNHLAGAGCTECKIASMRSNTQEFIDRAKLVHGSRFDYSLAEYVGSQSKVKIICKEHGVFLQTPDTHLRGKGCHECGNNKLNAEIFIERSKSKHGADRYDYSLVDYINMNTKVKIICKEHGEFLQWPHNHFRENGCPDCAESGYKTSKPGTLYYVRFDLPELTLWKIGITNNTVKKRFFGFDVKPIILWERRWSDGSIAAKLEKGILEDPRYDTYRYRGDRVLQTGNTECFTIDIMTLGYSRSISRIAA
jgi:hypothetical protein